MFFCVCVILFPRLSRLASIVSRNLLDEGFWMYILLSRSTTVPSLMNARRISGEFSVRHSIMTQNGLQMLSSVKFVLTQFRMTLKLSLFMIFSFSRGCWASNMRMWSVVAHMSTDGMVHPLSSSIRRSTQSTESIRFRSSIREEKEGEKIKMHCCG